MPQRTQLFSVLVEFARHPLFLEKSKQKSRANSKNTELDVRRLPHELGLNAVDAEIAQLSS